MRSFTMNDTTDSERLLPNVEEGEIEKIKVEPSQSSQSNIEEELTDIIKVEPDHSLLLEEDILGGPDPTAEVVESFNAGSSHEQELSTIELVRVDQVREKRCKRTSSVATQCSPERESTFPETDNSNLTYISSSAGLPEERGLDAPSQEDASRNRFYRHLSLPNKRGQLPKKLAEPAVFRRDIEKLAKHAKDIRETKLKAKKVRMERERRKGLAELFDNLQAAVHQTNVHENQMSTKQAVKIHQIAHARSRSSYLARTLAAVDCIKELEMKVK